VPEAEALRVEAEAEAEALTILALPHHWPILINLISNIFSLIRKYIEIFLLFLFA
jgi:hypothetical protein